MPYIERDDGGFRYGNLPNAHIPPRVTCDGEEIPVNRGLISLSGISEGDRIDYNGGEIEIVDVKASHVTFEILHE